MTTIKNRIQVDTKGVKEYLKTIEQARKELKAIEVDLKKNGFKGNEKELKAAAKTYQRESIKAINKIEDEEIKRIKKVESEQAKSTKRSFDERKKGRPQSIGSALGGLKKNTGFDLGGLNAGKLTGLTKGLGGVAGAAGIAGTAVLGIGVAVKSVVDQVEPLLRTTAQVTGLLGDELNEVTASLQGTATTFGQDFNEVLLASNTLVNEFSVSFEEANNLIDEGFIAGADVGGDFLTVIKEYAPQFKAAGISAEQLINTANVSVKEGLFDDKLFDVIKEGTLSLKENSQATRDALQPLGELTNAQIRAAVDSGNAIEALSIIGQRVSELNLSVAQEQAIIADTFKSAGEDLGSRTLPILAKFGKTVNEVSKSTSKYTKAQEKSLQLNKDLAAAQVTLTENTSEFFTGLSNFATGALIVVIESFNKYLEVMRDLTGQTAALAEAQRVQDIIDDPERKAKFQADILARRKEVRKELELLTTKEQIYARAAANGRDFLYELEQDRLDVIEGIVKEGDEDVDNNKDLVKLTLAQLKNLKAIGTITADQEKRLEKLLQLEKDRNAAIKERREKEKADNNELTFTLATSVQEAIKQASDLFGEGFDVQGSQALENAQKLRDAYAETLKNVKNVKTSNKELTEDLGNAVAEQKQAAEQFEKRENVFKKVFEKPLKPGEDFNLSEKFTLTGLFPDATERATAEKRFANFIEGGYITAFDLAEGVTSEAADKIFGRLVKQGLDTQGILEGLAKEGITSPILNALGADADKAQGEVEKIKQQIKDNNNFIKEQGQDGAKALADIDAKILALQGKATADFKKNSEKRLDVIAGLSGSALKDAIENGTAGVDAALDAFDAKQAAIRLKLQNVAEKKSVDLNKELTALGKAQVDFVSTAEGFKVVGLANLEFDDTLPANVQQLVKSFSLSANELRKVDLEASKDRGEFLTSFVDDIVNQIKNSTTKGKRELQVQLKDINAEILANEFDLGELLKVSADKRSDEQNKQIKDNIDERLRLEDERFERVQELTNAESVLKLIDLSSQVDVNTQLKELQAQQRKDLIEHLIKKAKIRDKAGDEQTKKLTITAKEATQIATTYAETLSDLFNAYVDFQDQISQNAIDRIREQLSNLESEISNSTSNIDSLEADLEDSRSGRRDALLRGIDQEKERQDSLNERKIQLERELEAEERKQAERRKAAAISQAGINLALGITGILAGQISGNPVVDAIIKAGLIAGLTGVATFQIASIAKQEFAEGGLVERYQEGGLLKGPLHTQGGIPAIVAGGRMIEMEGDEFIMKRSAVRRIGVENLNALNEGSLNFKKFQTGGLASANFGNISNGFSGARRREIADSNKQVFQVSVEEIASALAERVRVEEVTFLD